MFENIFKRKDNNVEKLNSIKKYRVKDLYVAWPAIITKGINENGNSCVIYNENDEKLEKIIVRKLGKGQFVENVLNGREYGVLMEFNYFEALKFVNQYMVAKLSPLELALDDKSKSFITTSEIKQLLYPELFELENKNNESNYRDVVLREINETNNKINASSLSCIEKEKLKKSLIEIANYYVENLKSLSIKNNQGLLLEVNKKSIIDLRRESMKKLVEIELLLPPESINDLIGELSLLEENIKKIK